LYLLLLQDDIEQIMEHFKAFKKNVPVMGGILLDKTMQRVLLVKGWKNTACWGFPRGKIHKNETDAQCAVREVCCTATSSRKMAQQLHVKVLHCNCTQQMLSVMPSQLRSCAAPIVWQQEKLAAGLLTHVASPGCAKPALSA
jgi:hypothetical protein